MPRPAWKAEREPTLRIHCESQPGLWRCNGRFLAFRSIRAAHWRRTLSINTFLKLIFSNIIIISQVFLPKHYFIFLKWDHEARAQNDVTAGRIL